MPSENQPFAMTSVEARVIQASLVTLTEATQRNADAVVGISESLSILTRLESQQGNLMDRLRDDSEKLKDHETRIRAQELEMPGLREMRKWVIGGIIAVVAMVCGALVKLVVVDVPRIPQYVVTPREDGQPVPVRPARSSKD